MSPPFALSAWLRYAPWWSLLSLLLVLLALLLVVLQSLQVRRLRRRMERLTELSTPVHLVQALETQARTLTELGGRLKEAEAELGRTRQSLRESFRRLGLVRFNAFDGVGAELSFSLALLSDEGDGLVLTGLYGREETRVYAKPIRKGASSYPLSEEEQRAIAAAWQRTP